MSNRQKPNKPTGETGPTLISFGPQGVKSEFQQLAFPKQKEAVEALIIQGFLRTAGALLPFHIESCTPNQQDDFDFSLTTSAGPKNVELAEVALLDNQTPSYRAAPASYKPYDFAQRVLDLILSKSAHYAQRPPTGLHLLLYITHWAFIPSESALKLLQFWTLKRAHGFEGVYWYAPIASQDGIPFLIYPTPSEQWSTFDPESFRSSEVHNLNPRGWVPGSH
jgi:hypothetical protein